MSETAQSCGIESRRGSPVQSMNVLPSISIRIRFFVTVQSIRADFLVLTAIRSTQCHFCQIAFHRARQFLMHSWLTRTESTIPSDQAKNQAMAPWCWDGNSTFADSVYSSERGQEVRSCLRFPGSKDRFL